MKFESFLLKDTSGKKSLTATAFAVGFLVANFKLLTSGLTYGSFTFGQFSGSDYGLALGALGAIYILRRNGATDEQTKAD
jgi:hypothetical protein